jgi:hypothetical protein
MSRPFCNNLKKNDRVLDTVSERQGKVARKLRSDGHRLTPVILDGTKTARYLDVAQLRFMVGGTPEDVAPFDGDLPPIREEAQVARPEFKDSVAALVAERDANAEEMKGIEKRFKELRAKNDRLERAIAVLNAPEGNEP